jgi:hypothetical protein
MDSPPTWCWDPARQDWYFWSAARGCYTYSKGETVLAPELESTTKEGNHESYNGAAIPIDNTTGGNVDVFDEISQSTTKPVHGEYPRENYDYSHSGLGLVDAKSCQLATVKKSEPQGNKRTAEYFVYPSKFCECFSHWLFKS